MIVFEDADVDGAVSAASVGRFFNCGQACLAVKRLYVEEASRRRGGREARRQGRAAPRSAQGPLEGITIGPFTARSSARRSRSRSRRRLGAGRRAAAAGSQLAGDPYANGLFYEPTLVLEPARDARSPPRRCSGLRCRSGGSRGSTRRSSSRTRATFGLGSSVLTRDLDRRHDRCREARGRLHVDQLAPEDVRRASFRRRR